MGEPRVPQLVQYPSVEGPGLGRPKRRGGPGGGWAGRHRLRRRRADRPSRRSHRRVRPARRRAILRRSATACCRHRVCSTRSAAIASGSRPSPAVNRPPWWNGSVIRLVTEPFSCDGPAPAGLALTGSASSWPTVGRRVVGRIAAFGSITRFPLGSPGAAGVPRAVAGNAYGSGCCSGSGSQGRRAVTFADKWR